MPAKLRLTLTDPIKANSVLQKLIWLRAALHLILAAWELFFSEKAALPVLLTAPVNLVLAALLIFAGLEIKKFERWAFHLALLDAFLSLPLTVIFGRWNPVSLPVLLASAALLGWIFLPAVNTPFARCPVDKGQRIRARQSK